MKSATTTTRLYRRLTQPASRSDICYLLEVYVDDFVSLVIPTSREQLHHVSTGTMTGIHDIFPAEDNNSNDPISEKKLTQLDGETLCNHYG